PAAEAVIADRHRDRHVDADHSDIDPRRELARRMAIAGEDRYAVAIVVLGRKADRLFEILRADHLEDGPENLVLVALHVRRHAVEEGRSDEEAFLVALQLEA